MLSPPEFAQRTPTNPALESFSGLSIFPRAESIFKYISEIEIAP